MPVTNDYLNSQFGDARFEKDHNEISHGDNRGFIGRIWDRLCGVTKLSNIFHQMSIDVAADNVADFAAAENCIKLKEKVANETCKISWATRWFGGHGDVAKSAAEVAKAAETQLYNYWTNDDIAVNAITDNQRTSVVDIYSLLQKDDISAEECTELDAAVFALLNIDNADVARYEKLADFFNTKCGATPLAHFHTGRALEVRGAQVDRPGAARDKAKALYARARESYDQAANDGSIVALQRIERYNREGGVGQKRDLAQAHQLAIELADSCPSYKKIVATDLLIGIGTKRNYAEAFHYAKANSQEAWSRPIQTIAKHLQNLDPTDDQIIELDDAVASLLDAQYIKPFYAELTYAGCNVAQGHWVRLGDLTKDDNVTFHIKSAHRAGFKPVMASMEARLRRGSAMVDKNPAEAHRLAVELAEEKGIPHYIFTAARDKLIGFGTPVNFAGAIRDAEVLALNSPLGAKEIRAKCTNLYKAGDILQLRPNQITSQQLEQLEYNLRLIATNDQDYADMIDLMSENGIPAAQYLKAQASNDPVEQQELYIHAANAGLPAAQYHFSMILRDRGLEEDLGYAQGLARDAALHGDMNAKVLVAKDLAASGDILHATEHFVWLFESQDASPKIREVVAIELTKICKHHMREGDYLGVVAMMENEGCSELDIGLFTVGYMYKHGVFFEENLTKATSWFKHIKLSSLMLEAGSHAMTAGDARLASMWFSKMVELDDSRGYYCQGGLLEHTGDLDQALPNYIKAAEDGVDEAWYPAIHMLSEGIGGPKDLQKAIAMIKDPARPQDDARINYLQAQLELKKWLPNWTLVTQLLTSAADQGHFGANSLLVSLVDKRKVKPSQVPNFDAYEESVNFQAGRLEEILASTVKKASDGTFSSRELLECLEYIRQVAAVRESQDEPLVSDAVRQLAYVAGEDDYQVEADIAALEAEDLAVLRNLGVLTSSPTFLAVAEQADALLHSIVYQDSAFTEDHTIALNLAMNRVTPLGQFRVWLKQAIQTPPSAALQQCVAGFGWAIQRGNDLLKALNGADRAVVETLVRFLASNDAQGTMAILTKWLGVEEKAINNMTESYRSYLAAAR
ncbi:MAG: hypothetical protein Q8K75_10100 [Chlamydiales bacterium]|nr:hypothetical protein [Chlamydiales bacterium]